MAYAVCQFYTQDRAGNVLKNVQVEVRLESNGNLATIYEDREGVEELPNPFYSDVDGLARFFAPGGAYKITSSKGTTLQVLRYVAIGLAAEGDGGDYPDVPGAPGQVIVAGDDNTAAAADGLFSDPESDYALSVRNRPMEQVLEAGQQEVRKVVPDPTDTDAPGFYESLQQVALTNGPTGEADYYNNVWHAGWNWKNGARVDTNESGFGLSLENKYCEGGAKFFHEWHLQQQTAAGVSRRYIYTLMPHDGSSGSAMSLRFDKVAYEDLAGNGWFQFNSVDKLVSFIGVTEFSIGIDNSDSDLWKLSSGTALGTGDIITASSSAIGFKQTVTLTKGAKPTAHAAGTKSSGTFTPSSADGNYQTATNGGAHTLAPLADDGSVLVQYTNNGSAGAITTSGFTKVTGDAFTTTNGDDFFCFITRLNGFSHLHVQALQ